MKYLSKILILAVCLALVLSSACFAFADDDIQPLADTVTITFNNHVFNIDISQEAQPLDNMPISAYRTGSNYATSLGYTMIPRGVRYGTEDSYLVLAQDDNFGYLLAVVNGIAVWGYPTSVYHAGYCVGRTSNDEYIACCATRADRFAVVDPAYPARQNNSNFDITVGYYLVKSANEIEADVSLYAFALRTGYALEIDTGRTSIPYLLETSSYRSLSSLGTNYRGLSVRNSGTRLDSYNLNSATNYQVSLKRNGDKYNGVHSNTSDGSQFLYIINPVYYGNINEIERAQTVYVTTTVPARSIRVIPLTLDGYFNGSIDASSGAGIVTSAGNVITEKPDGTTSPAIYVQVDGGNSADLVPKDNTSVLGIITDAVNSIKSLFLDTSDAINNLVNAGGEFVGNFVSLFDFLPAPVLGTFFSAVVVVIVIGVLKVFL